MGKRCAIPYPVGAVYELPVGCTGTKSRLYPDLTKARTQILQSADILKQVCKNERKIKKADSSLFILYNNSITPSVLVECGFLSNPFEAEELKSEDYQNRLAFILTASFLEYYNRE